LLTPYSWSFDSTLNAYTFRIKDGTKYHIVFYETGDAYFAAYPTIKKLLYEISFSPDARYRGQDNRISITIVDIVQAILRSGKIIMFVCDSADRKEKGRHKLFGTWFEKYGDGFEKYDNEILTDECNYYCSLIIDTNHPNRSVILKAFEQANDEYSGYKNT